MSAKQVWKVPQILGACFMAFGCGVVVFGCHYAVAAQTAIEANEFRAVTVGGQVITAIGIIVWALGRVGEWFDSD